MNDIPAMQQTILMTQRKNNQVEAANKPEQQVNTT
jgi:hypothetical protein